MRIRWWKSLWYKKYYSKLYEDCKLILMRFNIQDRKKLVFFGKNWFLLVRKSDFFVVLYAGGKQRKRGECLPENVAVEKWVMLIFRKESSATLFFRVHVNCIRAERKVCRAISICAKLYRIFCTCTSRCLYFVRFPSSYLHLRFFIISRKYFTYNEFGA